MIDHRHHVARLVQRAINSSAKHFPGLSQVPRVVAEAVELVKSAESAGGENWYFVPVEVHRDYEQMASIYRIMADVETELEETSDLSILISPRVIPFRTYEDMAS